MIDHKGHFSIIDTPPKTETKATLRDQTPRTVVEEMCDAHHEGDVDALQKRGVLQDVSKLRVCGRSGAAHRDHCRR